jgi:hypothetical protein
MLHGGILLKWNNCRNLNQENQCVGVDITTGRCERVVGMESIL